VIIQSIAVSRFDRIVLNFEGYDFQSIAFKDRRRVIGSLQFNFVRHGAGRRAGKHLFCVMRRAVIYVQAVGLSESANDFFNSRGAIDFDRFRASGNPALRNRFTQVADVVRMKVRQQDRAEVLRWQFVQRNLAPRTGTVVKR
jgi:hypothetical protein